MATITLKRANEYINRMRDYTILINGEKAGTIANGETKTFVTSAAQNTLAAKIDWCSSEAITFNIKADETKNFKVSGFKNSNWLMPLTSGIIALHFILILFTEFHFTIFLVIPAFIILLYYLTFGRKKYLSLTALGNA
jgi:hypothetical protein